MPRMDGTGPLGQGPMTGRGMGSCADNSVKKGEALKTPQLGRGTRGGIGRGAGRGVGRGAGRRFMD